MATQKPTKPASGNPKEPSKEVQKLPEGAYGESYVPYSARNNQNYRCRRSRAEAHVAKKLAQAASAFLDEQDELFISADNRRKADGSED